MHFRFGFGPSILLQTDVFCVLGITFEALDDWLELAGHLHLHSVVLDFPKPFPQAGIELN